MWFMKETFMDSILQGRAPACLAGGVRLIPQLRSAFMYCMAKLYFKTSEHLSETCTFFP